MPAHAAPASVAAAIREQDVRERRPAANETPTQLATIEPDEVLALAADVEQPAAEGERDRESGRASASSPCRSVWLRLYASRWIVFVSHGTWKSQLKPAPSKMPL